jgi:hypothetical protein
MNRKWRRSRIVWTIRRSRQRFSRGRRPRPASILGDGDWVNRRYQNQQHLLGDSPLATMRTSNQRFGQDFGDVFRMRTGQIADLMPATGAGRDDLGSRRLLPNLRHQVGGDLNR